MKKIVIAILIMVMYGCATSSSEWKRIHEEADSQTEQDILLYLETSPDSFEKLYQLGLFYLKFCRNTEAEKVFEKMQRLFPSAVEVKWVRAEILRRSHKLDESEMILKVSLRKSRNIILLS